PALPSLLLLHLGAYLLNDALDVAVDRTNDLRAGDLLVRGVVSARAATVLAVLWLAAGLAVAPLAGRPAAFWYAAAAAALVGYDLTGKRCPVPPAMDFLLGAGCAATVFLGAAASGGPSGATVLAA